MGKYIQYLKKLMEHKYYVYKAGRKTGVPFLRCVFHDASKFLPVEFLPYGVYNFNGENTEEIQFNFDKAWLHHQNKNPHHWQYWILVYDEDGMVCLDMPETYIREMIADWMGASKAYTGSWDMSEWLTKNWSNVKLSDKTRDKLQLLLEELGYKFIFECGEEKVEVDDMGGIWYWEILNIQLGQ